MGSLPTQCYCQTPAPNHLGIAPACDTKTFVRFTWQWLHDYSNRLRSLAFEYTEDFQWRKALQIIDAGLPLIKDVDNHSSSSVVLWISGYSVLLVEQVPADGSIRSQENFDVAYCLYRSCLEVHHKTYQICYNPLPFLLFRQLVLHIVPSCYMDYRQVQHKFLFVKLSENKFGLIYNVCSLCLVY